jgi:hypothetical protein
MPALNARAHFGQAARSFDGVRASVGLQRPASVRKLAELYARDLVFDEPIVTSDGVALGGHHTLTVRRDGTYRYQGHLRATGFPSYEVSLVTTLGYPIPVPGSATPAAQQIAFATHGEVHGTNEPGDRQHNWDDQGFAPLVKSQWHAVRSSTMNRKLEYDTDWFGPTGDVVSFIAQVVAVGATAGSAGVAIVVAGKAAEMLDIEQLVLPGMVGIVVAGGAGFVFGPAAMFPAFVIGAAVTAATVKQKHLSDEEKQFADKVFQGKVPYDRVLLTNLVGLGDRPFTAPGPGGVILVNMGKGYDDPIRYTGKGGDQLDVSAPGQLLIHELTHAWQIANESFTPEYYCRAVTTAAGTTGGDMSAYGYGPAVGDWGSFGTEQQGSIVEDWFAGKANPDERSPQRPFPEMHSDDKGEKQNPYYRYIRDNIRTGVA